MFKTAIKVVAVFALICVAYVAYQWQDNTPLPPRKTAAPAVARRTPASQPTSQSAGIEINGSRVQEGIEPIVRVIDPETGESKIVIAAKTSEPLSDTRFRVTEPRARVLLPGGQLAYVRADEGEVVVQRTDKSGYNPKRGKLVGHVQLFIDRSKPDWRKENPDLVDPEQHPEAVYKIWMDDVEFDLDLARLQTAGPITVQSYDATVEGRGLTLVWNEVSRDVKLLKIDQGKRASIRVKSLVQLGITGTEGESAPANPAAAAELPVAVSPIPMDVVTSAPGAVEPLPKQKGKGKSSRLKLSGLDDDDDDPKPDRIDTYQVVFKGNIEAEQRQGLRLVGSLKADMLELLRDFGAQERSAVEHADVSSAAGAKTADAGKAQARVGPTVARSASAADRDTGKESTLELRWSGELIVTPHYSKASATQPVGDKGRFQVVAEGSPVQIHDRQTGDATCRRLEYHDQTQQIWLTGTPEDYVTLQADARRQIAGERIFLDRRAGVARVEGSGRMTDMRADKQDKWPECIKEELRKHARVSVKSAPKAKAQGQVEQVMVTWTGGVEVSFGMHQVLQPDPAGGPQQARSKEYLKSATFAGDVSFSQPGQSMAADRIDLVFTPPVDAKDAGDDAVTSGAVAAQSMHAEGNVRMTNDESTIACDRLDVDMTVNDVGDNVASVGRAFGNVVARQGKQEIRAEGEMTVTLASLPKEVDPVERERFEAAAKACGYTAESQDWKDVEKELQSRRETVVQTLLARKGVSVRDPAQDVDVAAEMLDCSFDRKQQIVRALVMGTKDVPAHVAMTDFYIRGPQINFNVADETAEVPGEGILRFHTKQDLSGRRVDEPVPVVVSWKNGMSFRGQMNAAQFSGQVRAVSENTVLDARELNLRFENLPRPTATQAATTSDTRWLAGRVIDLLAERNAPPETSAAGLSRDLRKKLVYLQAVGDCVVASSEYEQPQPRFGPFSSMMASIMPDSMTGVKTPAAAELRLLSFVRIAGPRLAVNLVDEYMVVEGAGNLLVLDYRMPSASKKSSDDANGAASALVGSLQSAGPSQTVFTWQNSMTYMNRRCQAVLDKQVVMKHAAGSEMALPDQVGAAMKIDPKTLKGRKAELTCENLIAEFERAPGRSDGQASALSSAVKLRALTATKRVRMEENSRAVEGDVIQYDSNDGKVRILGSPELPAWGAELTDTGHLRFSWRGQELEWDLKTGVIISKDTNITATGK